jgi:hypothetical protein
MTRPRGGKNAKEQARSLRQIINHTLDRQARLHSRAMITARHGRSPGGYKHSEGRGYRES